MERIFKTSLFGYSKKSVCQYVADMNREFSEKLLAKDLECQNMVRELKETMEKLEQENLQLRTRQEEVAVTLLDAKRFANELRVQAEEEDRIQRARALACQTAEQQRIRTLTESADQLRSSFCSMLQRMDREMEEYRVRCQAAMASGAAADSTDTDSTETETTGAAAASEDGVQNEWNDQNEQSERA